MKVFSGNRQATGKWAVSVISAALVAGAWSTSSLACSGDTPILGSVCIMATPSNYGSFNRTYTPAWGQLLSINSNTALYSLIGVNFGGDGRTTFGLPDLRGKVVIGANTTNYPVGSTGGQESISLSVAQLPVHALPITSIPVDLSKLSVNTSLTGLTATANLSNVSISGPASGLTVKVVSNGSGQTTPSGNYLGKAPGLTSALYANGTPDATLNSGTIGGTLSLSAADGTTAPVNFSGSPTTTFGGTATASGTTGLIGSGAAVSVMQPYVALNYYIATSGVYPSRD